MKLTLTGINFNFASGYTEPYTGVNLAFNTTGATFNLSGYVETTKEEYEAVGTDLTQLTNLIVQKVQASLTTEA